VILPSIPFDLAVSTGIILAGVASVWGSLRAGQRAHGRAIRTLNQKLGLENGGAAQFVGVELCRDRHVNLTHRIGDLERGAAEGQTIRDRLTAIETRLGDIHQALIRNGRL